MARFISAATIFDQSRSWQYRAIAASLGTTTGAIVQAMLLKRTSVGPALGDNCDILIDGTVVTKIRQNGIWGRPAPIGSIVAVRDNFRRLADHCKFSDADREALFTELRKWVRKDFRAKSEA